MPRAPKLQPPFAWLGPYTSQIALAATAALGAIFRFWRLGTIPPGLYNTPAAIGLQALALAHHAHLPGLVSANNYAPLWVALQSIMVKILGSSLLALRLWPAIFGTLAVLTTWLWTKNWFGLRAAWLSALLMAVTPWAVTLSRDGSSVAIIPFLATLTLWLATLARRKPGLITYTALAVALVANLFSGPLGWLIFATTLGIGLSIMIRERKLNLTGRNHVLATCVLLGGLAGFVMTATISLHNLKHLPSTLGLTINPMTLTANLLKVLFMFNVSGDQNWRHNLAGEPMLNAFVGLTLVAGLLVGISRLHERRYRLIFVILIIGIITTTLSTVGVPNAAHAAFMMPAIFVISAIGISYLLELWYTTFPINSAARTAGQSAVIVLLGLTIFQGYTQYFRAWAAASEVYAAYDEGAVGMAHYMASTPFTGTRYIVAPADQLPVIAYLNYDKAPYQVVAAEAITSLPATTPVEFLIASASRSDATKALQAKFPGHILQPQYSTFNQAQIYYVYDSTK